MIAKLTDKTTNSEKAIYFLSLMATNKLKSHMLFIRKDFTLSNFTKKKTFASEDSGGTGAPPTPRSPLFLCGPVLALMF